MSDSCLKDRNVAFKQSGSNSISKIHAKTTISAPMSVTSEKLFYIYKRLRTLLSCLHFEILTGNYEAKEKNSLPVRLLPGFYHGL